MDFYLLLNIRVKTLVNISVKTLSTTFGQKLFDHAKRSATDAPKTSSKRVIQKNSRSNQ